MVIVFYMQWESSVLSMNLFFLANLKKFYIFYIDILCIILKFVRYFMNSKTNRNQSEVQNNSLYRR